MFFCVLAHLDWVSITCHHKRVGNHTNIISNNVKVALKFNKVKWSKISCTVS